jgi:hypothetical protein
LADSPSRRSAAALLFGRQCLGAVEPLGLSSWVFLGALGLGNGHAVLDLAGHECEGLFDVLAVLGRSLEEAHVEMLSQLLALFVRDGALVFKIALVADKDSRNVVRSVLLDFAHPGLDSGEALSVGDVVGDYDTVGTLVVARCDRLEALLASSVPDLQLDSLCVDVNGANLEIYSNGWHEVVCENIVLI